MIMQALADLSHWRKRYSKTLELSYPFQKGKESRSPASVFTETALIGTFITLHVLLCLRRKRWPSESDYKKETEYGCLWVLSVPIWSHALIYGIMGITRPYDGHFVATLSILGIHKILSL